MALSIEVLPGERVRIGNTTITIEDKTGRRSRLRIESSEHVSLEKAGAVPTRPPPSESPPTTSVAPKLTRPNLKAAR